MRLFELCGKDQSIRFSPFVWRVKMALAHKGLAYDTETITFTNKDAIAESGSKTVPVLHENGQWISDSWEIAVYLENTYADQPTIFGGDIGLTSARLFGQFVDSTIIAPMFLSIVADIPAHLVEEDKEYFVKSRERRIGMTLAESIECRPNNLEALSKALMPVRRHLKDNEFIAGESPLYHDYLLFGLFQWARIASPVQLIEDDDIIFDWRERMLDLFDGFARQAPSPHL